MSISIIEAISSLNCQMNEKYWYVIKCSTRTINHTNVFIKLKYIFYHKDEDRKSKFTPNVIWSSEFWIKNKVNYYKYKRVD